MVSRTYIQNIKNIFTNFYFHIWLLAKTWLNFLVDDIKDHYKIEKNKKIKKIIDIVIIITNYIYFLFLNKNLKFISKYLNITYNKKSLSF
jgi:uncharacterized membrane protein YbaN (DUF454 family)